MLLSKAEHDRVRAAVDQAEKRTSAEIICVLARQSGEYWETPLAWAGAAALIAPALALLAGLQPDLIARLLGGWTAAHAAAVETAVAQALIAYVALQAALFALVALVASIHPLRLALTPRALKREHAHRRALEQFAAQAYHLTSARTGVVIFASLAERQAIVIADEDVAAKLAQGVWSDVVAELIGGMKAGDPGAGFAAAIAKAADHLEGPFPHDPNDPTDLPDTVIELDH
jgi:putative membrane protein